MSDDPKKHNEDTPRLALPAINAEDGFTMAPIQHKQIKETLLAKQAEGKGVCSWCGNDNWRLSPAIYTRTLFNVIENHHIHNRVDAYVVLGCANCGNQMHFSLSSLGLGTKGALGEKKKSGDM